jgi:hypothetical protein
LDRFVHVDVVGSRKGSHDRRRNDGRERNFAKSSDNARDALAWKHSQELSGGVRGDHRKNIVEIVEDSLPSLGGRADMGQRWTDRCPAFDCWFIRPV